ncbi:MAG: sulfatase-like hydrolase/transferase [Maledivibacter sp.]|nr:sulfatase-like hydrolase/transferase [Maledivibacter sp.]
MKLQKRIVEKVNELKTQKENIKELVNKGDLKSAKFKLERYKCEISYDIDIYSIEATILICEGKLYDAKSILEKGLKLKPFNFDLNYNLAYVYRLESSILISLDYYLNAVRCANNSQEKDLIIDVLKQITCDSNIINSLGKDYMLFKDKLHKIINYRAEHDNRHFPITENNELLISTAIFKDERGGYYSNYYRSEELLNYPTSLWKIFKNEILYGKKIRRKVELEIKENSIIPISTTSFDTKLKLKVNDEEYKIEKLIPNRFSYFSIDKNSKVSINSNKTFILGQSLNKEDKNKIKLVLPIFIDGLSQSVIEGKNFRKLMPNTYEFFKEGTKFTNYYTNGEWTLPAVANIFTGKYTTNHKLFNPRINYDIGRETPLLSEQFKNQGYFTFQACGDWRKSPLYGYAKGFNRTIYQSAAWSKMGCEEVICEAVEQLRAFKDRSHFMWLSIFELHHACDDIFYKISSQINNSLFSKTITHDENKSVDRGFDERRIEKYVNELQRVDLYLGFLYGFIEKTYKDDEIMVMILSDHGQGFLDKNKELLKESRIKVPFMIKGRNIPAGYCDEIMESVDVYPTLLRLCDIEFTEELDGKLPKYFKGEGEKKFSYTESIYPEKTYKASINDKEHNFMFESKYLVDNDGRFDISDCFFRLISKKTGETETELYLDKVEEYLDIIFEHTKEYIKI